MGKYTMSAASSGRAVVLAVLVACGLAGHAFAAPIVFQDGLPPSLVLDIKQEPDGSLSQGQLREQIEELGKLVTWAKEHEPKTGWFARTFGSQGATSVSIDDLAQYGAKMKGQTVTVQGVYQKTKGTDAEFRTDRLRCLISLAEGAQPTGFGKKEIWGLPAVVEGTVEMRGDTPVLRASSVRPAAGLSLLRVARADELLGDYEAAVEAYLEVGGRMRGSGGDLAAFARVSAGRIAYDNLRDKRAAAKHYNMAWTTYLTNVPANRLPYHVWIPDKAAKRWERMDVREAIGDRLNSLNSESFWYRFVAFFVALCGGNAALGVLLIAVVVRVIIWPLTKKQLQSAEAMKRLQPQIKELQAKLADDKQKFQQEFWKLCQANGVNPLGGCLPLLVQMPVLIMVYKGIRLYIVEFDKASFLWVDNLAGPDMILLVAYTISMILFQKMTQKTNPQAAMDPQQEQQQKMMMYMMPLMFFFFFKSFPASFILYWLGTNMIYFLQQWNYSRAMAGDHAAGGDTRKQGGFVGSMVRMLSGEPASTGDNGSTGNEEEDQLDRRSLDEIHKAEKKGAKRKKGSRRK